MKRVVSLFPGQGTQYMGMCVSLSKEYSSAKNVLEHTNQLLGYSLSDIMSNGPSSTLTDTLHAQLAVFTHSWSVVQVLLELGIDLRQSRYTLGHSLGEYTSLCLCGTLSFQDTVLTIQNRANAMSLEGVPESERGGMSALFPMNEQEGIGLVSELRELGYPSWLACINSNNQIVVAGPHSSLDQIESITKRKGNGKRVKYTKLNTSAAFHSELMRPATELFCRDREYPRLNTRIGNTPGMVSSVSGRYQSLESAEGVSEMRDLLRSQIEGQVRWGPALSNVCTSLMEEECGDPLHFLLLGPGSQLTPTIKSVLKTFPTDTKTPSPIISVLAESCDIQSFVSVYGSTL